MSAQVVINSLEFARKGESLRGTIPVADLGRLQDVLYSSEGMIEYTLSGGSDEQGNPVLDGTIKCMLRLKCQRCFEGLDYLLDLAPRFALVEDEQGFGDLAEEAESVDLIRAEPELDVLALVEDEILLSLPMSPLHPLAECKAGRYLDQTEAAEPKNPFGALAALKKQDLK